MAETVARGVHGCVGGGGNIHPRLMVGLYEAAAAGRREEAARLQEQLAVLGQIYRIGQDVPSIIKGIKCALGCMDVCDDRMAEPFLPFNAAGRAIVRQHLQALGLLPGGSGGSDVLRASHAIGAAVASRVVAAAAAVGGGR